MTTIKLFQKELREKSAKITGKRWCRSGRHEAPADQFNNPNKNYCDACIARKTPPRKVT